MHKLVENTDQLRPCPFCGIKRQVVDVRDGGPPMYGFPSYIGAVHCGSCGATVEGKAMTIEAAVRLAMISWNARVPENRYKITKDQGRARYL